MKLHRPYIPIYVRLRVAERMCDERLAESPLRIKSYWSETAKEKLAICLAHLFPDYEDKQIQLDHDPALTNRKYNSRTKKYTPDANDVDFLIYRAKEDHNIKTRVRGDGAQYSDLALRRKNKRIERNKTRPVRKIASRPFFRGNKGD